MHPNLRLALAFLGSALAALTAASSATPDPHTSARPWDETVPLELRALGTVGGVPLALLDVAGEPTLVSRQSGLLSLRVQALDPSHHRIVLVTRTGTERVLTLDRPSSFTFPTVDPEPFLTATARAQRQSRRPAAPSRDLIRTWPTLTRPAKEALLRDALCQGTLLQVHIEASGAVSTTTGFLFAERDQARDRFLASLTPQQHEEFKSCASPAIWFTAPATEIEARKAAGRAAAQRQERFLANLTPTQRSLYANWVESIDPTASSTP